MNPMERSAEREPPARRSGRAATSTAELSHIGLRLFLERGFEAVTVDEIAAAAGIGRRTFFRYFASKNDLPWGDFDALVAAMREHLAETSDEVPMVEALREAIVEFNRYPPEEVGYHRQRMQLLFTVPALVGHSSLRYESWRRVIAEFVARRTRTAPDDLLPSAVSSAMLGAALGAYSHWLAHPAADLAAVMRAAFDDLAAVFGSS